MPITGLINLDFKNILKGDTLLKLYKSRRIVNFDDYDGDRYICTAIYYLLLGNQFSSFHRMKSDENMAFLYWQQSNIIHYS